VRPLNEGLKRTSLPADADIALEAATSLTDNIGNSKQIQSRAVFSLLQFSMNRTAEEPTLPNAQTTVFEPSCADPAFVIG
jgi:hypothetical protein